MYAAINAPQALNLTASKCIVLVAVRRICCSAQQGLKRLVPHADMLQAETEVRAEGEPQQLVLILCRATAGIENPLHEERGRRLVVLQQMLEEMVAFRQEGHS